MDILTEGEIAAFWDQQKENNVSYFRWFPGLEMPPPTKDMENSVFFFGRRFSRSLPRQLRLEIWFRFLVKEALKAGRESMHGHGGGWDHFVPCTEVNLRQFVHSFDCPLLVINIEADEEAEEIELELFNFEDSNRPAVVSISKHERALDCNCSEFQRHRRSKPAENFCLHAYQIMRLLGYDPTDAEFWKLAAPKKKLYERMNLKLPLMDEDGKSIPCVCCGEVMKTEELWKISSCEKCNFPLEMTKVHLLNLPAGAPFAAAATTDAAAAAPPASSSSSSLPAERRDMSASPAATSADKAGPAGPDLRPLFEKLGLPEDLRLRCIAKPDKEGFRLFQLGDITTDELKRKEFFSLQLHSRIRVQQELKKLFPGAHACNRNGLKFLVFMQRPTTEDILLANSLLVSIVKETPQK